MPSNPTRLTPAREAEIRARLAAATPGEWRTKVWEAPQHLVYSPGPFVAMTVHGNDENNAAFIANAPTDLADVLAEVDALRAQNASAYESAEASYDLLADAIQVHLAREVRPDDGAEEQILADAVERAGRVLEALRADAERWRCVLPLLGQALHCKHFSDVNTAEMYLQIGDDKLRCGVGYGFNDDLVRAAVDLARATEAPTTPEAP